MGGSAPKHRDRGVDQRQADNGQEVPELTISRFREKNTITKIITCDDGLDHEFRRLRLGIPAAPQRRRQADPVTAGSPAPHSIAAFIRMVPDRYCATAPPSSSANPIEMHIQQHQPKTIHDRGS